MADVQDQVPVAGAPTPALDDRPAPVRLRDDAPFDSPIASLEAFRAGGNYAAVRLEPGDDARVLIPFFDRLKLIEVAFPKFRDGRGYSAAQILRQAGYTGELRAAGDVLLDQLYFMRRAGFDSFLPNKPLDASRIAAAFDRFPEVYMKAADGRTPAFALRHGALRHG